MKTPFLVAGCIVTLALAAAMPNQAAAKPDMFVLVQERPDGDHRHFLRAI